MAITGQAMALGEALRRQFTLMAGVRVLVVFYKNIQTSGHVNGWVIRKSRANY